MRQAKLYFDLTTSLCWGGAPVGITRVEREIARRAVGRSLIPVRYCFFHRPTETYFELRSEVADEVLNGKMSVDRDDLLSASFKDFAIYDELQVVLNSVGRGPEADARSIMAASSYVKALPLADLVEAHNHNAFVHVNRNNERRAVLCRELTTGPVKLSPNVWIINGGLDWEHKDLRAIRKIKKKSNFKYIAIIYDLIPLLFPQYVVPFYVDLLKKYFGEMFWLADMALCISDTTKADAEQYLESWRMPAMPMYSWPLGCDIHVGDETVEYGFPKLTDKKYLLYVSTIEPRKSHRTIVEAFEHSLREGRLSDDTCCVFVGRVGWNTDNLVQEIQNNPLLKDRIIIMSGVSDEELARLYINARFVVFPSKYEGYGLSLVEAMGLGKACISGTAGSLREVGGTAPLYIDPYDIKAWALAITDFMSNDAIVSEYERKSRAEYKTVTWDDSADLFYRNLSNGMALLS